MAVSGKVVGTLFEDELSLDESNSKDGEDVYGYLGEPILRRKLNPDYCCMRTWVAKIETKIQDEDSMWCSNEEGVVRSGYSDNCDNHNEIGGTTPGTKLNMVGEIILFE